MARATAFYTEKLGLKVVHAASEGTLFGAGGGTMVFVYEYGKTKAEHTVAVFRVSDLKATMESLKANGIVFEDYDLPGLKTVDGVAASESGNGAWFKDSEGNILSIIDM
jgi:catechol 2,3-dioxygenase-like lactoylglutathione lyase family enzyme